MKLKFLSFVLAVVMVLAATGCRNTEPAPSESVPAPSTSVGSDAGTGAPSSCQTLSGFP